MDTVAGQDCRAMSLGHASKPATAHGNENCLQDGKEAAGLKKLSILGFKFVFFLRLP